MSYIADIMDQEGCYEKPPTRDRRCSAVAHGDSIRRSDQHHQNCPSFSSTLLDAIYRSIDEGGAGGHPHRQQQLSFSFHHEAITHCKGGVLKGQDPKMGTDDYQRLYGVERLMDRKGNEKVITVQQKSIADLRTSPGGIQNNSSSSSSDSSSNKGGFSSFDSDYSSHSESRSRSSSSCYSMKKKLKPIRTSISIDRPRVPDMLGEDVNFRAHQVLLRSNVHKQEGGVAMAKSKALKIYGEFKKVSGNNNRQPISPGGKLSSFLNSLFNAKKGKISTGYDENFPGKAPKSGYSSSTCSSATSFSRSCLSKSSSRGKFTNDRTKRSVRFCPVSVVVDEDCRPCGQKSVPLGDPYELGSRKSLVEGHQGSESTAKNYRITGGDGEPYEDEDQEDDDDDGASCASSDLFELENLSGIGGYRYSEELPVYETTNLDTNRAIANGLMV